MEFLIEFLILLFAWGWVALGIVGVLRLVTSLGATRRPRRIIVAVGMIVVAVFWARLVQPLTWGVTCQSIRTEDGKTEATVYRSGARTQTLVIRRDGNKVVADLGSAQPVRVFWIQEGKTVGVDIQGSHRIVDIDILFDANINGTHFSPEEMRRLNYYRQLDPDEERLFMEASKAATE